jgi:TfoX/Sxy family transcriptional regulator of competence genes
MDRKPWPKASKELGERLAPHMEKFHGERRKMFGADVWFINGNMFAGVFGDGMILRLSDEDGMSIKKEMPGVGVFSPGEVMVMREYVLIPSEFLRDLENLDRWIERSYDLVKSLPVKAPKKRKG